MSEVSTNNYDNQITWIIILSIGLFIISLIFNIFFLINGLFSTILGIYYVYSINNEISKLKDGIDSNSLYNYSLFLSWTILVVGIISIFIYIVLIYFNRNKGINTKNSAIKRNYVNTK